VVHHRGTTWRIAVIDGLGHGPEAARAAQEAVRVLDTHTDASPDKALNACHAALGGTRGAAISIASVDLAVGRLTYSGIGNIEAHLWQDGVQSRPVSYRGIVGSAMRTVRSFELPLGDPWLLVLHSDGLSSKLDVESLTAARADPQVTAETLLARWGRQSDDATVIVIVPALCSE
jgi:serine/threonine protein phosphatase PrpC